MKKIIILILISLSFISLNSCKYVDTDEEDIYVVYNESKYYQILGYKGNFTFTGDSHKVGTYYTSLGYRYQLYCLDSDIEENILFEYGAGATVWLKEGYQFDREAKIDTINIFNRRETINIEIKNCSFNNLFIEINETNFEVSDEYTYLYITLTYGENIKWSCSLELLDGNSLYLATFKYDHEKKVFNGFKLADEYQEKFKSYIIGLNSDNNIEE